MDGHLVLTSSDSNIRCSLENFTLDAERWLAALHWCVQTSYGDDAAHAAADCWLRVFEEQLEGSSDLPELTRITVTAIALFVSRLVLAVNARFQNRTVWKHALAIMRQLKVPQLRAARGTLTDLTI